MASSSFARLRNAAVAAVLAAGSLGALTAPAAAAPPQCASNHNLAHVDRRLAGAISQLNHDDRDYGGYRAQAVSQLSSARQQLGQAIHFAISHDGDNPRCFRDYEGTGGDFNWGLRGQGGSNHDIWGVDRWTRDLESQLQSDDRDYDGHRVAAINDIQNARNDMLAAERFARSHGY